LDESEALKTGKFELAHEIGADGVKIDTGSPVQGNLIDNKLRE
jgi:hypothetical protein